MVDEIKTHTSIEDLFAREFPGVKLIRRGHAYGRAARSTRIPIQASISTSSGSALSASDAARAAALSTSMPKHVTLKKTRKLFGS